MIAEVRTDPFIFRGSVNEAGYEWTKGMDGKPRLVPCHEPGRGIREYEPPKGLFREFANLKPTQEAIKDFANRNGDLFHRYSALDQVMREGTMSGGAPMKRWNAEIEDMRTLVDLWEQIKDRQIPELKKIIKWTDTEVGYVIKTPKRERSVTLAHAAIPETGFSRFSPKDVLLPARCALQLEVNVRLADQPTVPRLAWTPDYHQRIIFTPPNLLSAMWLQFAQAITGELELRMCKACGKYFQVGPGGRRVDATTCSDACRQRKKRKGEN